MRFRFLVKQYFKCWNFFRESRWHIVFSLGIFALMFIVGFAYPVFFRDEIFTLIKKLIIMFNGKSITNTIILIFLNNIHVSLMAIIFGIGIGVFSLIIGITNGYLLGFVSRNAVNIGGISVLWHLAPHGIFELPATIFSIGVGLKIGGDMFIGKVKERLKYNFVEGLRFFIFVIIPLLIIAAIIEGLFIGLLN